MRCEIDELLTKLRLLSMGFHHHYIVHLPGFLADKTSFSLLALAKAQTPAQCLPVLAGTPYAKVLQSVLPAIFADMEAVGEAGLTESLDIPEHAEAYDVSSASPLFDESSEEARDLH